MTRTLSWGKSVGNRRRHGSVCWRRFYKCTKNTRKARLAFLKSWRLPTMVLVGSRSRSHGFLDQSVYWNSSRSGALGAAGSCDESQGVSMPQLPQFWSYQKSKVEYDISQRPSDYLPRIWCGWDWEHPTRSLQPFVSSTCQPNIKVGAQQKNREKATEDHPCACGWPLCSGYSKTSKTLSGQPSVLVTVQADPDLPA